MRALLAALVIVLRPLPEPTLRLVDRTGSRGLYVLHNPLDNPITVTLQCDLSYEKPKLRVEAGQKLEVEFKSPEGKPEFGCWILEWKQSK